MFSSAFYVKDLNKKKQLRTFFFFFNAGCPEPDCAHLELIPTTPSSHGCFTCLRMG